MIYLIADTHFGENSIRMYENRPFESVEAMDAALISNWNRTVQNGDEVYFLGDFGAEGSEELVLRRLNGVKYLVKGNHDTKSNEYYRNAGFAECYDHPIIMEGFWILSHEPLYVNTNMPYANLFGHVHNSPLYKTCSSRHYCVSVERIRYTPVSFEEIKKRIREDENSLVGEKRQKAL